MYYRLPLHSAGRVCDALGRFLIRSWSHTHKSNVFESLFGGLCVCGNIEYVTFYLKCFWYGENGNFAWLVVCCTHLHIFILAQIFHFLSWILFFCSSCCYCILFLLLLLSPTSNGFIHNVFSAYVGYLCHTFILNLSLFVLSVFSFPIFLPAMAICIHFRTHKHVHPNTLTHTHEYMNRRLKSRTSSS